jgi:SM-20-related protein
MNPLDLEALRRAPLTREPFEYAVVPGFIPPGPLAAVERDFPVIEQPGSVPPSELEYGAAFGELLDALQEPEMAAVIAEKFDIDLRGRPTMLTVRGVIRPTDGQIHTDSRTKLITVLLYLNRDWDSTGGRLRLLRSPDSLDDYLVEVPPDAGTLLAFRCRPNAWHGHKPADGVRRTIQLNWVTSQSVAWRETLRHQLSARVKRLRRLIGGGSAAGAKVAAHDKRAAGE